MLLIAWVTRWRKQIVSCRFDPESQLLTHIHTSTPSFFNSFWVETRFHDMLVKYSCHKSQLYQHFGGSGIADSRVLNSGYGETGINELWYSELVFDDSAMGELLLVNRNRPNALWRFPVHASRQSLNITAFVMKAQYTQDYLLRRAMWA